MIACRVAQKKGMHAHINMKNNVRFTPVCSYVISYPNKTKFAVPVPDIRGNYIPDSKYIVPVIPEKSCSVSSFLIFLFFSSFRTLAKNCHKMQTDCL